MTVWANPQDDIQRLFDGLRPHTTVMLSEGTYHQKLVLRVPHVTVVGCGNVVLQFDDFAKKLDLDTNLLGGTFKSFTLAVCADDVTLKNLCVKNVAGNPAELGQEVALSVYGTRFRAENCSFVSTQDTLFCGPLPADLVQRYKDFLPPHLNTDYPTLQHFVNCKIVGTVDFIFGCATALFERCEIVSANDGRDCGYVAAPAHPKEETFGFVFYRCNLTSDNAPKTFLARPWRDFGKATFAFCTYGNHVVPSGFSNWQDTDRDKTARFAEYSQVAYPRAAWATALTESQATAFVAQVKKLFEY